MKVALKLMLVLLVGTCLLLAVVMRLQVDRETDLFEKDSAKDDALMARWLAQAAAFIERDRGPDAANAYIEAADQGSDRLQLRRLPGGPPTGESLKPSSPEVPEARYRIIPSASGERTIYTYLDIPGGLGTLEVAEPLTAERQYVRTTVLRHLATAGAIAAVSGLLALVLGYAVVGSPVRRMVDQARRVGAGDLSGRLLARGGDELGQLAREIDRMVEQLAEARQRLEAETAEKIRTLEQLRRADRLVTVGKLASGIAHELGTPLSVVSARAKMIATREDEGEAAAASARIVMEQSTRMGRIIRQLLDFARPRPPVREPLDLRQLAAQSVSLLSSMAGPRGIDLEFDGRDEPVTAPVDGNQVQQVLSNLIMNAIQASARGGRVEVAVSTARARPPADRPGPEGEFALIRVADRGEGIPEENLVHIFEPFFTTKDVGEGTGLGLSVSNGIVREHGGWIDVQSKAGEGACFWVYLPKEPR